LSPILLWALVEPPPHFGQPPSLIVRRSMTELSAKVKTLLFERTLNVCL